MAIYNRALPTGVVDAFDEAWEMDKAHCPLYFR